MTEIKTLLWENIIFRTRSIILAGNSFDILNSLNLEDQSVKCTVSMSFRYDTRIIYNVDTKRENNP